MFRKLPFQICTVFLAMAIVLFVLTACGTSRTSISRVKYEPENRPKERTLGVMRFHDEEDAVIREIELGKIRGGYALRTPIVETDSYRVMGVVSKSKEYNWFSGVQMKWEF